LHLLSRFEASRWRSSAISFERKFSCEVPRGPSVRERPWPARDASLPRPKSRSPRATLGWPAKRLDAARATLEKHGDRVNAAHARYLGVRRLLLIGHIAEAERTLADLDPAPFPPALRTAHELVVAGDRDTAPADEGGAGSARSGRARSTRRAHPCADR